MNTNVYGTLEHILCHNIPIHNRYTHILVHHTGKCAMYEYMCISIVH